MTDDIPFDEVGPYAIEGVLDTGGMGIVYAGRDKRLGRRVVVKTLQAETARTPEARERLQQEARIAGRLDHDAICPVLDVVEEHDRFFVVMPFIDGCTLGERLDGVRQESTTKDARESLWLSFSGDDDDDAAPAAHEGNASAESGSGRGLAELPRALRMLEKVARAMHFAHERGIVHRDLKPANIMIRENGDPVVLDFGLARDLADSDRSRLTQDGDTMGTPLYMAPEQIEGNRDAIGPLTDVYALGVILYEVITLSTPFTGSSRGALYHSILRGNPRPPRQLNADIPRDLDAVCLKALDVEPERRYDSALDLAEDLRSVRMLRPTKAKPPSWAGRIWRGTRRHRGTSIAVAGLIVAAICATIFFQHARTRDEDARRAEAVTRVLLALYDGELPSEDDLELARPVLPEEAAARLARLKERAGARADADLGKPGEGSTVTTRAGSVSHPQAELLMPRGAVADLAPRFTIDVPDDLAGNRSGQVKVQVLGPDDKTVHEVDLESLEAGLFEFSLPKDVKLKPGEYQWRIVSEAMKKIKDAPPPQNLATFEVVPPEVREAILARQWTGDEVTDVLLRASELNSRRLTAESEAVLRGLTGRLTESQERLRKRILDEAKRIREIGRVSGKR